MDIAASGAIPENHIASIGLIYHERLAELLDATPPVSPTVGHAPQRPTTTPLPAAAGATVATSPVAATSTAATGAVPANPGGDTGREPARPARTFAVGNDYRNPVALLRELDERDTADAAGPAANRAPAAAPAARGGGDHYASAKAVACTVAATIVGAEVSAEVSAPPAPRSEYASARAVLAGVSATDPAYESTANGDGPPATTGGRAGRDVLVPAAPGAMSPAAAPFTAPGAAAPQFSAGYEEPVAANPMYATPFSVEDAAGDAGLPAQPLLLGDPGSSRITDADRDVLQRAAHGSRKRRGHTGDPLVAMIGGSGAGASAGGTGPTGTRIGSEPGSSEPATGGSVVIMRAPSASSPRLPPADYPVRGVGVGESTTDEDLYSTIALAREGRSRAKVLPYGSIRLADTVLGKGKFGVVRDGTFTPGAGDDGPDTGKPLRVAVKMLHPGLDPDELREQHDDMAREAKVMAHFTHPNIVRLVGTMPWPRHPILGHPILGHPILGPRTRSSRRSEHLRNRPYRAVPSRPVYPQRCGPSLALAVFVAD